LLNPWNALTAAGDSAVLLPLIVWITLWLMIPAATRRDGWRWILAVALCGGGVTLSKLLFMGWNIGIPGLDYTGLSGHSAMSMMVWPTIAALLSRRSDTRWHVLAIGSGVCLALGIAVSRVLLSAHSVSEVILGSGYGLLVCAGFLRVQPAAQKVSPRAIALFAGMGLLIALICYGRVFPSQHILKQVAMELSGHDKVFSRSVALP
jgi:membrane-associated phospholipid phosphatase